jgi:hypothetical protein
MMAKMYAETCWGIRKDKFDKQTVALYISWFSSFIVLSICTEMNNIKHTSLSLAFAILLQEKLFT